MIFLLLLFSFEIYGQNILEGVGNPEAGIDLSQLLNPGGNVKKPVSKIDRALNILEGLQKQINQLRSSVDKIQKMQADLKATKKDCRGSGILIFQDLFVNKIQSSSL